MAEITELMNVKLLKTNIWSTNIEKKIKPEVFYDKYNDTLTMVFDQCDGRILVQYVDYYVGLLFRHEDKEIIGIQIDTFSKGFFPVHAQENKGWCLSESGVQIKGNDFVLFCKTENNRVVEKVTSITSDIMKREGVRLQPIYA